MSDDLVTIGTYLQFLQLKVKLIYVGEPNEASLCTITPREQPQPRSEFLKINIPPSLRLADICPEIGNFAIDANGDPFHPDTNIFDYIRTTGGDIYTRNLSAFSINCEPKQNFRVPKTLAKVNPHRFLFAVQQYFHKELSIGCRVVIDRSALPTLRIAQDTYELIVMLHGAIPVELMYPQVTKLKLHNRSTIELDTSSYYWSDNVFLLSDDIIEKLKVLVALYETPEKRKARELASTANHIRSILSAEKFGDDLLAINDNEAFMGEFVKGFICEEQTEPVFNLRVVRVINAVNDSIGTMELMALNAMRRVGATGLHIITKIYRVVADFTRFLFANELAALFIYLTFTVIMFASARRGSFYLYGLLSSIAIIFSAATILRVRYNVDLTNVIVKHTFPEVYPADLASAELDKNVQLICEISDASQRSIAISKQVDAMRRFPNVLKAVNVCILGTVPSLILAWREEIERRRATLTSLVRNAVDQELKRRETPGSEEVPSNEILPPNLE